MEENKTNLTEQELEEVSGGANHPVQRTNFCRRCRGSAYKVLRMEPDGSELRECKTCHLVYIYKKF